jgi:ribosomal protein S8
MGKVTQKQRILEHLKKHGEITSWEAIKEYGCTRLAAVIATLKNDYSIVSEPKTVTNRFGDKVTVAKYKFIGEKVLS